MIKKNSLQIISDNIVDKASGTSCTINDLLKKLVYSFLLSVWYSEEVYTSDSWPLDAFQDNLQRWAVFPL